MADANQNIDASAPLNPIAGFWRRLLAFLVDCLVLGVLGFCIGLLSYDYLAQLGGWGRAIGFVIALMYFAIMNSGISAGQTLGKQLAKIKVISSDGEPLDIGRSVLRFGILGIPFFLNGAPFDSNTLTSWFAIVLSILIFGLGLSIIYLFVFNRKTRQSLHDLIARSYVVPTDSAVELTRRHGPWPGHYVVVGVVLICATLAPIYTGKLAQTEPFIDLLTLQQALESEPGVQSANVNVGSTTFIRTEKDMRSETSISCRVILLRRVTDYDSLVNRLVLIVLNNYPSAAEKNSIAVSMSYGYDIGIASSWQTQNFVFSPTQWRKRIESKSIKN